MLVQPIIHKHLQALLQNNEQGIRAIYDLFQEKVIQWVVRNNGSRGDGEDLFQEGLIVILKYAKRDPYFLTSSFQTFLLSVCKKMWYKELKKRKDRMNRMTKRYPVDLPAPSNLLEAILEEQQRYARYQDSFLKLTNKEQRILQVYLKGWSHQEIADYFNLSNSNASKQRIFKIKTKLKRIVRKHSN